MEPEKRRFVCIKCGEEKDISEKPQRGNDCKTCRAKYKRGWDLDLSRKLNKFKTTMEEFMALLSSCAGRCDICGIPLSRSNMVIDHNHKTNKVRGLLCRKCNTGIGLLKDSVHVIEAAKKYLEERSHFGTFRKPRKKRPFGKKRTEQFKEYIETWDLKNQKTPFLEKNKEPSTKKSRKRSTT